MNKTKSSMPEIVSALQWQAAADQLLMKEKELTLLYDTLNAERRQLPMVKIEKDYVFEGKSGALQLPDLFEGRRQLIVYHFMYAPEADAGCPGCSWVADAMSHPAHLHARDTSIVMVSRAPLEKLHAYWDRMGWKFPIPWYSSYQSDFNTDFGATTDAGEVHGLSVFLRDGNNIYRTYYTGDRGVEHLGSHWTYLDLTPFGRQETWEKSPEGWPQEEPYKWLRRHDEYDS